jgi:creatinine amidohydrolase
LHLPVGADGLGVTYEASRAVERVSRALDDWSIVLMPYIAYGRGGANQLGDMFVHPGTYALRGSTLRAIVADLGAQVAQNGFKWIFVLNGHGAPMHNMAINEACDFVSQTFGVTMLHLSTLFAADEAIQAAGQRVRARHFSAAEVASFGMDVHAGVGETSAMLAVRPDLVQGNYKALPARAGSTLEELRKIALTPGWQGYLSAPARASAAHGRAFENWWIEGFADLMLRAVRGENMFVHARNNETLPPAISMVFEKALAQETVLGDKLDAWLAQRSRR